MDESDLESIANRFRYEITELVAVSRALSSEPEIPVESRILTIADIFDALTASDRPYKKAVPVERALSILDSEVRSGKCDPDLFRVFVEGEVYRVLF